MKCRSFVFIQIKSLRTKFGPPKQIFGSLGLSSKLNVVDKFFMCKYFLPYICIKNYQRKEDERHLMQRKGGKLFSEQKGYYFLNKYVLWQYRWHQMTLLQQLYTQHYTTTLPSWWWLSKRVPLQDESGNFVIYGIGEADK